MPVIKSAKKKLRQDIKKEKINDLLREELASAIKLAKKSKLEEKVKLAVKKVDKAAKKGLIHKNKAARIKSSLNKLVKITSQKRKKEKKANNKKIASKTTK